VAALLPLRNIIVIYNLYNPQTNGPDTRVVGHLVTVRPGNTLMYVNCRRAKEIKLGSSEAGVK
jgi:hypothetical protein